MSQNNCSVIPEQTTHLVTKCAQTGLEAAQIGVIEVRCVDDQLALFVEHSGREAMVMRMTLCIFVNVLFLDLKNFYSHR